MEGMWGAVALIVGAGVIWLVTQRWFWILVFFVGALAAGFAMLASIIHFQILAAVGLFFVMMICWGIASGIVESG